VAVTVPYIELAGVVRRFGSRVALDHVTLSSNPGEVVVVCGPSGAGKTTLLRAIVGLERVDAGTVRVGRHDASASADLTAVRREVGLVFQELHLYPHMRARDQIALAPRRALGGSKAETLGQADALLAKVGLDGRGTAFPHELSGGERQRVAIARALATRPRALLLDEPTSALDPERTHEILSLVADLRATGLSLIVVTHELGFARRVANRVALMVGGSVLELAGVEDFFNRPSHPRTTEFLSRAAHFAL
jgi:ABC-type polar amino acid transport system ATPase subunit